MNDLTRPRSSRLRCIGIAAGEAGRKARVVVMMEETEYSDAPGVTLREQVEDLREQAREGTLRLAADARAQVAALVRRRQDLLADRLGGIAAALRDAGRRLLHEAAGGRRPAATAASGG